MREPWHLLSGMSIPEVPPTPKGADDSPPMPIVDMMLLSWASAYGSCHAYAQEQRGRIVQDIVPAPGMEETQTSGSSSAPLAMHTEASFHPHRPSHVALLCLRGDPAAVTTLAPVESAVAMLDPSQRAVLAQPRFHTGVDDSFRQNGEPDQRVPVSVLGVDPHTGDFACAYDEALTRGDDPLAASALREFTGALRVASRDVVLRAGDLLVVDNRVVVHGRRAFRARYDGTDRWLKRALVFDYRVPPGELSGSTITTGEFAGG